MTNYYDNKLEDKYSSETDAKHRKSLGQFFTPFKVASFMADWILDNKKKSLSLLDPATGLGIFERAIDSKNQDKKIAFDLWEIDKKISNILPAALSEIEFEKNIITGDFLTSSWNKKYDGIIANPPYYKHHFIKNKNDIYQQICSKTYFNFSIQTNIYCWFLIKAMNLLNDGGKLAFIVPSEFLNANYGEDIKKYLIQSGIVLHLINVNYKESVFDNALTTSIIVLAEKNKINSSAINFFNVSKIEELSNLTTFLEKHERREIDVKILDPKVKWRNYFNGYTKKEDKNLIPLSEIGKFSRGIATGSNEYFTLTLEQKNELNIPKECLIPCITKSNFVKGIKFTKENFSELINQNKKVYLFNGLISDNKDCTAYIKKGEQEGIHNRFLTKNRSPWYALEKRDLSNIWAPVFNRKGLKFIWNTSDCINLTCFHSFYPKKKEYLDVLFIYLNTDFAKKLFDREKREYGDGLDKFEPNDINKSLVLNFGILSENDFNNLKTLQTIFIDSTEDKRKDIMNQADSIFKNYYQLN